MEFLGEDPLTYKIDTFGGVILNAWIMPTRSMRVPGWQVLDDPGAYDFVPPLALLDSLRSVSKAMLAAGVGYASFDLMRTRDGFKIIEINTSGVGTHIWAKWPERYAATYSEAILQTLGRLGSIPPFHQLRARAHSAGSEAYSPALTVAATDQREDPSGAPRGSEIPARPEIIFHRSLSGTDRLPAEQLQGFWLRPLEALLRHARQTARLYESRLAPLFKPDDSVDWSQWARIPVTCREDLQRHRESLLSRAVPPVHGAVSHARTAGSTGEPVTVSRSRMELAARSCIQARLYHWHGIRLDQPMATFLRDVENLTNSTGSWVPDWLPTPHGVEHRHSIDAPIDQQLRWLAALGPVSLRTTPSHARLLALAAARTPEARPQLAAILTQGETATEDMRRICRKHLGRDIIDAYHLTEAGLVALQCPVSNLYHLQSEVCVVEVVDASGHACGPGEIGEVVVTPIYNFAMPLIRYATGDLAETRADAQAQPGPCGCGRTLPTIRRILGARRNTLHFVGRAPCQPDVDSQVLVEALGAQEWQLVQVGAKEVEVRFISEWPDDQTDRRAAGRHVRGTLPADVSIAVVRAATTSSRRSGRRSDYLCMT
jgi:phenylacetate-CoA ligase